MPEEGKERMSVWVESQDRDSMKEIRAAFGLPTDSAAIRYAVREVARQIRRRNRRPAPGHGASGSEGGE